MVVHRAENKQMRRNHKVLTVKGYHTMAFYSVCAFDQVKSTYVQQDLHLRWADTRYTGLKMCKITKENLL